MEYHILNIYGPNLDNEKAKFLELLGSTVHKYNSEECFLLVAGDFNLVLNNQLDIIAGMTHDKKCVEKFNSMVRKCDLYDVWRLFHGKQKEFTWSSSYTPWKARRLDYILCNTAACNAVTDCFIQSSANTDHRGVYLELQLPQNSRGPGYWKFNDSLLQDKQYVGLLNVQISELKENLRDNNPHLKWDYCKGKIKDFTINYCKQKARTKKKSYIIPKEYSKRATCPSSSRRHFG